MALKGEASHLIGQDSIQRMQIRLGLASGVSQSSGFLPPWPRVMLRGPGGTLSRRIGAHRLLLPPGTGEGDRDTDTVSERRGLQYSQ